MVGSQKESQPPVLRLADNSEVAGSILLYFSLFTNGQPDPPSHYAALLRYFVIDMGHNPNISAVSMSGAQLCSIEDVSIRGKDFYSGIVGLPGSGGYTANVIVQGGKVREARLKP